MPKRGRKPHDGPVIAFESYGVRVLIELISEKQVGLVQPYLPPGWKPCEPEETSETFAFDVDNVLRWRLVRNGKKVNRNGLEFPNVLLLLESQMRTYIALNSPNYIFVHSGAVAVGERLLVLPGLSFAGKTTLVAEFVKLGATYYSDEYALLDVEGLVHAYPRPLSLRNPDLSRTNTHVGQLGGVAADKPLRISDIVITTYTPGAEWDPRRLSPGESALGLLSHTVAARSRGEQAMKHITRAVNGAAAFEGPRGESGPFAAMLYEELSR